MSAQYELIVYTAAKQEYADQILDHLETEHKYFAHRLYKKQCLPSPSPFVFKPLEMVSGNRKLKNIVIVDNNVCNYALTVRNGIPIKEYCGDDEDVELINLAKYLRNLTNQEDLTKTIAQDFADFFTAPSDPSAN